MNDDSISPFWIWTRAAWASTGINGTGFAMSPSHILYPERCCAECALVTETREYYSCSEKGGRLQAWVCEEEEDVTEMGHEGREYSRAVDAGRMYDDGLCRWSLCYCRYTAYACHIHLSHTAYRERWHHDGHPAHGRVVLRKIRAYYFHQLSGCNAPGVLGS